MKFIFFNILIFASYFQVQARDGKYLSGGQKRDSLIYYSELHHKARKIAISYTTSGVLVVRDLVSQAIIKRDTLGSVPRSTIRIEDYNHDGVKDIRYGYNSNYFYENLLLFDFASQTWKEVKNISDPNFAYSKRIPNSNMYYSYNPNGCGKNNWLSYLFIIDDFTVKPIGLIQYRQCPGDHQGIYLYKLAKKGQKLKQKLPLQPVPLQPVQNGKNFYAQYWPNHFKEYLQ